MLRPTFQGLWPSQSVGPGGGGVTMATQGVHRQGVHLHTHSCTYVLHIYTDDDTELVHMYVHIHTYFILYVYTYSMYPDSTPELGGTLRPAGGAAQAHGGGLTLPHVQGAGRRASARACGARLHRGWRSAFGQRSVLFGLLCCVVWFANSFYFWDLPGGVLAAHEHSLSLSLSQPCVARKV